MVIDLPVAVIDLSCAQGSCRLSRDPGADRTEGVAAWFFSWLKGMVSRNRRNKKVLIVGLRITRVLIRGEGTLSIYEKKGCRFFLFHQ